MPSPVGLPVEESDGTVLIELDRPQEHVWKNGLQDGHEHHHD
eukprot:CAMPEP_0170331364 /NCGR_PEP_ID=MMETSP0116_2-20130129/66659_1 /TAXON_ID=400756 /ORGANISM="Durinskia baltica, Strain CSIRO CS-38" /LENGTH=41 /DNA_ID= /DNA_START= /DNA_END= /DNA_ORIENTATION=